MKEDSARYEAVRQMLIDHRQFVMDNARILWEFEARSIAVASMEPITKQQLDEVWSEDHAAGLKETAWGTLTELCMAAGYDLDQEAS